MWQAHVTMAQVLHLTTFASPCSFVTRWCGAHLLMSMTLGCPHLLSPLKPSSTWRVSFAPLQSDLGTLGCLPSPRQSPQGSEAKKFLCMDSYNLSRQAALIHIAWKGFFALFHFVLFSLDKKKRFITWKDKRKERKKKGKKKREGKGKKKPGLKEKRLKKIHEVSMWIELLSDKAN